MPELMVTVRDAVRVIGGNELRVRRIGLNRTAKANALTASMMNTLAELFAKQDADLHILESASQRVFCAGADIAEFVESDQALAKQEHALLEMITQLSSARVPVVSVVRGKASGAGVVLLALSDLVIAAQDAELACPEVRFGMYPVIVDAVLKSRVSPALAQRMCLGQSLSADGAWNAGLVTEVIAGAQFAESVEQRLEFYIERTRALTIARTSRLFSEAANQAVAERVRVVAPLMAENFRSPGVKGSISAYLSSLSSKRSS